MKFEVYMLEDNAPGEEVLGELELDVFPPQNTIMTIMRATEVLEVFVVGTRIALSAMQLSASLVPVQHRLLVSLLTREPVKR